MKRKTSTSVPKERTEEDHNYSDVRIKRKDSSINAVDLLSLRYDSYKISPKSANFADRALTKTAISPPKYNIFQTVCADLRQTLASTSSIVNEANQKTSIEHLIHESFVAYVQWLILIDYTDTLVSIVGDSHV
jgi:hypothetical protein